MSRVETAAPPPAALLQQRLLAWYDRARRRLPWRAEPGAVADPYRVLLSEIMLQQTTVATVLGRFEAFIERFPSLEALAAASPDEVLHAWQGLGYYRRARALHAAAVRVVREHGGRLPADAAALARLPGLGPYTAAAVRAIAFAQPVLPIDGNVTRVLARLIGLEIPLPRGMARIRAEAARLAPSPRPADLAQAVMELGALVCTPRRPACLECPWRPHCRGHASGAPEALPRQAPKRRRAHRHAVAFLLERDDGAILFHRRPDEGLLGGLAELPSTPWRADEPWQLGEALASAPVAAAWEAVPATVRHSFTHLTLDVALLRARSPAGPDGLWCRPPELDRLALPTLTRKLLRHGGVRVAMRPVHGPANATAPPR
ncbi:MAG TPA: A/G-specific adenine glycosylase [Geminicoccaceae bacterium]|nr:A/G-specific adenine glycosylase [Geminicoccaceae bacterium]